MLYLFWLGFALISFAAGDYLFRRYRESQHIKKAQKEFDDSFNSPAALLAEQINKAGRNMSPEEYAELKKDVFAYIEALNKSNSRQR